MTSSSPNRTFLYIAACAANIAAFVCGTGFGWTSPELPKLKDNTTSPLDHELTDTQEGWIGSFLPLAAAIGPIGGGVLADIIGRKKTLLLGTLPFIVAYILNIFAKSVFIFYIGRFLSGIGVGIIFTVLPMYIGEISDDDVRGSLGSFMQFFIVIGLLFSYAIGPFVSIATFNIILVIPPVLFMIIFLIFIPDSPCYLLQTKNTKDALEALIRLRGREISFVQKEMEVMKVQVEKEQRDKGNFFDIFKCKGLRTALFLSVGLVAFQQLSGINIILFYSQNLFTDAGVALAPEICTIIIGVVQIIASGCTPLLVEKWGKRYLLLLSGVGMALSEGVLAFFFYLKDDKQSDVSSIGWLPIASMVVYIITYCLGFGPLPWAVMGELFPGNIKSVASSATASMCWILGFFITNYFGLLTQLIGKSGSFGFFTGWCLIAIAFVYKFLPETTGKNVHEIQYILSGGSRKPSYQI
ncbi:facilitated trehalose transporter Tret1 [Diabrotica virgifera virgifera]|uniref:Major facilitator superfamily (MFS) profile domain-containing protein n=1 Tax=Diabrotica virgifera virgifera TaxID=50390 RepID=A0ABM5ISW3_DIAVI|nr:facilitated trehalose transporter Tret1 [Diabrotica virgifera virgifera]